MISITLAIVIAIVVAVVASAAAVAYCRHHSDKCQARIEGILSEKALEISEPMTMVIGPLSLLIKKEPSGSSNRRMLQIAMANAERISSIMGLHLGNKDLFKHPSHKANSKSESDGNTHGQGMDSANKEALRETPETGEAGETGEAAETGKTSGLEDMSEALGEALDEANSFLERAQGVVNDHIDDSSFDKDTFAVEMYVSPSTLYKRIKQLSGLSPSDYIKEIRLTKALSLVEETDLPISVISDMCGFSTVAYFGYSFRKRYGITPSEKRKEGKN